MAANRGTREPIINALRLIDGAVLQIGQPWPGDGSDVKVGLIMERGELAENVLSQSAEEGEEEVRDEGAIETKAADYMIWLFPDEILGLLGAFFRSLSAQGQPPTQEAFEAALSRCPEVACREVRATCVLFAERRWTMLEAWPVVQEFLEEHMASVVPRQAVPQRALNGPQQSL